MVYLIKLKKLLKEKKYSELKLFCEEKLQFNQNDIDLLFYYAVALEQMEEYVSAKNTFERLFRITHDKIFRICEAIPEFMNGDRKTAVAILKYTTKTDKKSEHLFFAFKIAIDAGEEKIAVEALKKAFINNPKTFLSMLQEYFESLHEKRPERTVLFIALLELLKELEQK